MRRCVHSGWSAIVWPAATLAKLPAQVNHRLEKVDTSVAVGKM
jgi:hypothetical protein